MDHLHCQSAYIHIPFCISKCIYCDFASCTGSPADYERCTTATIREIELSPVYSPLATVFFGGGTPSVVGTGCLTSILSLLKQHFGFQPNAEISLEVNPATVDAGQLSQLKLAGFNRISIGIQCLDDNMLRLLGRRHNAEQAKQTIFDARTAGFENISIDLMSALPAQTLEHHIEQLKLGSELQPDHISCYSLTLEPQTPLYSLVANGTLALPDDGIQAEMMLATEQILSARGYHRYEVSNYCKPGFECRHNMVYWQSLPYFGFGPAAVSTIDGVRQSREPSPLRYAELIESEDSAVIDKELLTPEQQRFEFVMLALRTTAGFDNIELTNRFGEWPELPVICERMCRTGQLTPTGNGWKLTASGMLVANDVMLEFLP